MKKREVKFELLRILCMYMIVIGHCLFHGRVTAKLGYGTVNYFLDYLVQAFSVVHVNTFVMIGGYFAIDKVFQAWKTVETGGILLDSDLSVERSDHWCDKNRCGKSNLSYFCKDLLVCICLHGPACSDAICQYGGGKDDQETVPVSARGTDLVPEC